MSHRYRIAFRETLCSRKRGFYSSTSNGFVRDQSSFRETTIAAAGRDHNLNYEGSQLLRTKSTISSHRNSRYKDHSRLNNSIRWKENVKRVDSVKSTDSTLSTQSNNSSSNVIVVCIGNSFKTKCFTTSNTTGAKPTSTTSSSSLVSDNQSSSSLSSPSYKTTTSTTNNKLNHNAVNNLESNGTRINCQMNNLLEEDEDELDNQKIDNAISDEKEPLANGAHLSGDESDQKDALVVKEPQQSLIINCVNSLKSETRI